MCQDESEVEKCVNCKKEWYWNWCQDTYGDGDKFCKNIQINPQIVQHTCDCGEPLGYSVEDKIGCTLFTPHVEHDELEEVLEDDKALSKRKWYEEYEKDNMTWEEFDDKFHQCKDCGNFVDSPCICYAR